MKSAQQSNLVLHSPKLQKTDDGYALSVYNDMAPTSESLKIASNRLAIAFPKMTKEFFLLLTEFVLKENFTAKRLEDAVNHVIANFQYKELNISDIIKFDKKAKLYTGEEYKTAQMKKFKETGVSGTNEFEKRIINETIYWVKKSDLLNQ